MDTHTLSLFPFSLHTHSLIPSKTCLRAHTHTHTRNTELRSKVNHVFSSAAPPSPLSVLLLSNGCVYKCVCVCEREVVCTCVRADICLRLWELFCPHKFDALKAFFCLHMVNKQSCPPLPLFSSISLHLVDVFFSSSSSYETKFLCLH